MRLRRIEIRNFRKLAQPVVIDRLGDGLNLLSGDNEEGKSTVLAALKAALFEHHAGGGAVREAMTPLGRQDTPEVTLELELAGARYLLHKAFRRGGVRLVTPTGELRDDSAEQRLLELLRFERRQGRSEVKPQHLGLQALFWVDQGTTFQGFDGLAGGRERLSRAIEAEVGGVAIGERGRRLLEAIEEDRARYWTPKGWRETGLLKAAGERAAELRQRHAELDNRRKAYDDAVDRLAQLRDGRRRFIERDDLGQASTALERVRQEVAAVEALEGEERQAASDAAARTAEWQRLDAAAAGREQRIGQVVAFGRQIATAEAETRAARSAQDAAEQALSAADAAERATVERQAETEQRRLEVERRLRVVELEAEIARLARAHDEAGAAAEAVRSLRGRLDANPATTQCVDAARKAERTRAEANAGLRAVATRVELRPEPGAVARRDGKPLDPAHPLHVTERTELELLPFGRIVLSPGAGELDARRAELVRAKEALARALAALGAADLAAAEALLAERARLHGELTAANARLDAVLRGQDVRSVAELDDRLAELRGRQSRLRAEAPSEAGDDPTALRAALASVDETREQLRAEREARRAETERCAKHANEQREAVARAESAIELLGQQQRTATDGLAAERERLTDADLAQALADAATAKAAADARLAELRRLLVAANPALARDRLTQTERRLRELEAERLRLDREIGELAGELRGMGADSFGERLAAVEGELELAEAERARLLRQACAWRLLHDTLETAMMTARDAMLAPVRDRLRPYLHRLFPEAEAALDAETLALSHLRRDGQDERYDTLSVGTREQLAVLVRLAFARLLLEREGEAPCLILDDALVYADEARLEIMKTILQHAAEALQIIVLTCRPRDYLGLDARHIRLESCRAAPG